MADWPDGGSPWLTARTLTRSSALQTKEVPPGGASAQVRPFGCGSRIGGYELGHVPWNGSLTYLRSEFHDRRGLLP